MTPTRVWAIVDDGTPGGRPVEMHRATTGWRADMAVHADTTKYTALIDGKFRVTIVKKYLVDCDPGGEALNTIEELARLLGPRKE